MDLGRVCWPGSIAGCSPVSARTPRFMWCGCRRRRRRGSGIATPLGCRWVAPSSLLSTASWSTSSERWVTPRFRCSPLTPRRSCPGGEQRSRIRSVVFLGRSTVSGSGVSGFACGRMICGGEKSQLSSLRNSLRGLGQRAPRLIAMSDVRAAQGWSTSIATASPADRVGSAYCGYAWGQMGSGSR